MLTWMLHFSTNFCTTGLHTIRFHAKRSTHLSQYCILRMSADCDHNRAASCNTSFIFGPIRFDHRSEKPIGPPFSCCTAREIR